MLTLKESIDILTAAGFSVQKYSSHKEKWHISYDDINTSLYYLELKQLAINTEKMLIEHLQ